MPRAAFACFTALALLLSACATPQRVTERLSPADSATSLIIGGPVTLVTETRAGGDGQDPLVTMTLTAADGRVMRFTEANHTPYDVMAQAPGGPLANVMGLFNGDETPKLYSANNGNPALMCPPTGPRMLGVYRAADGGVKVVGLNSSFAFEPRDGGQYDPVPYSPDHVCARLAFRAG